MKKKLVVLLAAVCAVAMLGGCGSDKKNDKKSDKKENFFVRFFKWVMAW